MNSVVIGARSAVPHPILADLLAASPALATFTAVAKTAPATFATVVAGLDVTVEADRRWVTVKVQVGDLTLLFLHDSAPWSDPLFLVSYDGPDGARAHAILGLVKAAGTLGAAIGAFVPAILSPHAGIVLDDIVDVDDRDGIHTVTASPFVPIKAAA